MEQARAIWGQIEIECNLLTLGILGLGFGLMFNLERQLVVSATFIGLLQIYEL